MVGPDGILISIIGQERATYTFFAPATRQSVRGIVFHGVTGKPR